MPAYEKTTKPTGRRATHAMGAGGAPGAWSVVLPVKLLRNAKTRLAHLDPAAREALALAMATDTVAAALASDRVSALYVVSDDAATAVLGGAGAVVVPDAPNAGLNPALDHGAAEARRLRPDDGVVALTADIPAMKPAELSRMLDAASGHPRTVVADASGAGTVALTAAPGTALDPAFGADSLRSHVATGAVLLDIDAPGLRCDVDTIDDLRAALRLGCGPRTTAAASGLFLDTGAQQ